MHAHAPAGRSIGERGSRPRALERSLLVGLALMAPALCLGQQVSAGAPAAELPGASLPGAGLSIPGLMGAGATGLTPMPADYTRYGISAGVGGTDNVDFSSTHPKSQALAATNLFFDLIRTGSRLELNALGNFSDIDYLQNAYSNQVLGRFDGLANLMLWQNHLKWLVRDDYGDSQINVLQSLTPTNLQRVNLFSTGPDLTLQPTESSFVELQGIYSLIDYQTSPFSGHSEMGSFTVGHQLSPSSSISLVGQVQQQQFDDRSINTDYQVHEFYGHYQLKGARTAIDVQGGVAQANDRGSWRSSPLVRLAITRNVSPSSIVSLSGGRDYISTMGSFASLSSGVSGGIPIAGATQTTSNALRTYGGATWDFHYLRTALNLFGRWERDDYDLQSRDNVSRDQLGLNLNRQFTPRLSANIMASVDRGSYANEGFTQNYGTAGAGLVYRPGTWVVIYGRYDHQFMRSSGVTRDLAYDENRVYVMVGYYPHSSGTGTPGMSGMGGGFP